MKVIGINGSPRKNGNTSLMIRRVFAELEKEGIETELYQLGGQLVSGCRACRACFQRQDGQCAIKDDCINECIAKMAEAEGILLGSPTYFANCSTEMKALIDRAGYVGKANGDLYAGKVGATVSAVRRAGSLPTLDAMNRLLLGANMVVVGSSYWNLAIGREIGEVEGDEEGMRTMENLGKNMARVMKKLFG